MIERRGATRVRFESQVRLRAGKEEVEATVDARDISLKGMYVQTEQQLAVGTVCRVGISLTGSSSRVNFSVDGEICRCDGRGMGIAFDRLSEDSYVHIKNLVRLHAMDDPEEPGQR
ncbi:PilZ domain-containing protein [Thermodesulfobacteriota bacterium B35]